MAYRDALGAQAGLDQTGLDRNGHLMILYGDSPLLLPETCSG